MPFWPIPNYICSPYYIILILITETLTFGISYNIKCDLNLTAKRLYHLIATRISPCQLYQDVRNYYICEEKSTCLATLRWKRLQTISFLFLTFPISFFFHSEKAKIWKKDSKNQSKGRHYSGALTLSLGTEAWGNKTKIHLKAQHEKYTSFVLFPQALEPSVNFNTSKMVYLCIHTYQRNFGSHVTVRMSARPSVRPYQSLIPLVQDERTQTWHLYETLNVNGKRI